MKLKNTISSEGIPIRCIPNCNFFNVEANMFDYLKIFSNACAMISFLNIWCIKMRFFSQVEADLFDLLNSFCFLVISVEFSFKKSECLHGVLCLFYYM